MVMSPMLTISVLFYHYYYYNYYYLFALNKRTTLQAP